MDLPCGWERWESPKRRIRYSLRARCQEEVILARLLPNAR